jgi:hypothetical protein
MTMASDSLDALPKSTGRDDGYILRKTEDVSMHYTILEELGKGQVRGARELAPASQPPTSPLVHSRHSSILG